MNNGLLNVQAIPFSSVPPDGTSGGATFPGGLAGRTKLHLAWGGASSDIVVISPVTVFINFNIIGDVARGGNSG